MTMFFCYGLIELGCLFLTRAALHNDFLFDVDIAFAGDPSMGCNPIEPLPPMGEATIIGKLKGGLRPFGIELGWR